MTNAIAPHSARLAIFWLLLLPGTSLAVTEAARSSDRFVDSIGVNTHYGNAIYVGGNAYADRRIDDKLAEIGIRYIRDHSWNDTALGIVDNLYETHGVRSNFILGETTRSPADLVNLLKAHPGYEAIEGLNEPDFNTRSYNGFTDNPSANNYPATRAFQNDLYAAVKADPQTQSVQVLSPAMGASSRSQHLLPISFDVAAMHSYSSAREPTFNLDTFIGQMATLRGNPPKPLMSTEAGYYNNPVQFGWIPEHLSAKYIPRLHAEYFNRGIDRTYLYELANQGPDANEREQNFGLLRFDLTEKPGFTAMENLIDLLEEPGAAAFTPGSLNYTLTGSGAVSSLHHTLLQKSDGTFYLLLWNEVPVFNRFANNNQGAETTNAPLAVTLSLTTKIARARVFLPNDSLNATATYLNPAAINLSVPDRMLIVELSVLAGDYNRNGVVDAADYVLWRKTVGQTGANLAADGNLSGTIDDADYAVWMQNFGNTAASMSGAGAAGSIPEPATLLLFLVAVVHRAAWTCWLRSTRKRTEQKPWRD